MPGASPQSHDASGWGSSKMGHRHGGIVSGVPPLSLFLNPPPSPPNPMGGQPQNNRPRVEDSLLRK